MRNRKYCLALCAVALAPLGSAPALASGFHTVNALGQNGTTGGAGGPIYVVTTKAELESRLAGDSPKIVAVQGSIEFPTRDFGDELSIGSNTTLIGLGDDAELVYGGLRVINESNVIIRNLTIRDSYVEGDYDGKTQDYDGIQVDDSHHVWIDHMHITHMGDGLIDLRKDDLDYITVSNSILSNHNKAFGVGWSTESDQHVTIHNNWIHDTNQRNPSFDNVVGHFYNNLLEDISSYGLNPRGGAIVVSENNVFDNVNRPYLADAGTELVVRGDLVINSPNGSRPTGDAFEPSDFYDYQLVATADVRAWIEANAGPQASVGVLPWTGDFNGDGLVNAADYTVARDHLGEFEEGAIGYNGDGDDISASDLATWAEAYGSAGPTVVGSIFAVPEPAGAFLAVAAMGCAVRSRRSVLV